jgi:16S rRNA (adenine1518-N6/adenine1519-N6)-dimethyltransferase
VQAFYDAEYLFTVDETVLFRHQGKSGVLRLRRKADYSLPCGEKLFFHSS